MKKLFLLGFLFSANLFANDEVPFSPGTTKQLRKVCKYVPERFPLSYCEAAHEPSLSLIASGINAYLEKILVIMQKYDDHNCFFFVKNGELGVDPYVWENLHHLKTLLYAFVYKTKSLDATLIYNYLNLMLGMKNIKKSNYMHWNVGLKNKIYQLKRIVKLSITDNLPSFNEFRKATIIKNAEPSLVSSVPVPTHKPCKRKLVFN